MVLAAATMLIEIFGGATFEFKKNGTFEFVTQMEMGGVEKKPDQGTYTVDETAKTITTTTSRGKAEVVPYEIRENVLYLSMTDREHGKKLILVMSRVN